MTGREYTVKPANEPAPATDKDERKRRRRQAVKQFFVNLFTKRVGIKFLAIVLAAALVILINI